MGAYPSADPPLRNPITGIDGCCAVAASGHAAAPPSRRVGEDVATLTPQSGRIEARIGLRMMPTFPRSPLPFRTAGFPQYGWDARLSGQAFRVRRLSSR